MHSLKLDAGNLEPLYCSLELFNGHTGQQLSERFHFHVNSYSVINDFLDDFNYKKQLLKYHKEMPTPHAIFSLTNYSDNSNHSTVMDMLGGQLSNVLLTAAVSSLQSEEDKEFNLRDVYVLLQIEKTLQGQSMESIVKFYSTTTSSDAQEQNRSTIEAQCSGLKQYRQPFLFAFAPLFEYEHGGMSEGNIPVCADHGHDIRNSNGSPSRRTSVRTTDPIERSRRDSLRVSRRASTTLKHLSTLFSSAGSESKSSRNMGTVKLRTGLLPMRHMYVLDTYDNLIDVIQREGMRDGTLKRHKSVDGYCLLEISEFDAMDFEKNAHLRKQLVGRRKSTNQSFTLDQAIASVIRHNEEIQQKLTPRSTQSQNAEVSTSGADHSSKPEISNIESKQYLKFQCHEFTLHVPKSPFFTFTHKLYVYPGAVNFSKARPPGQSRLKPRNILCEVVFKESSTELGARIVQRYTNELVHTQHCAVSFMTKTPNFYDEICVMLPLPILPTHQYVVLVLYFKNSKTQNLTIFFSSPNQQPCFQFLPFAY